MKLYKILLGFFAIAILFACHNDEVNYPDFGYTTVYFANQFPMRTLELGNDPLIDNSLDNENKVRITATMGGVYSNTEDRIIHFEVDESLCDGVSFSGGSNVVPLPSSYYTLESDEMIIEAGSLLGGVIVEFNESFFQDPLTIGRNYVIPILMTDVTNADSILAGRAIAEDPRRVRSSDWEIAPKDYVLYGIKYVNPWHANYLRRGQDQISDGTGTVTDVRRAEYVEFDELVNTSTISYNSCRLPLSIYEDDNLTTRANIELVLTFDEEGNCTVSDDAANYNISGTGRFVSNGEVNSVGGLDRDALYLNYTVELSDLGYTYTTTDTLVCRDRGIAPEYFTIDSE